MNISDKVVDDLWPTERNNYRQDKAIIRCTSDHGPLLLSVFSLIFWFVQEALCRVCRFTLHNHLPDIFSMLIDVIWFNFYEGNVAIVFPI